MPDIAIVAGEASGDASGAALAVELKKLCPDVSVWGAGGPLMREAGVELVADFSWAGSIGIVEALKVIPRLTIEQARLKRLIAKRRPDVFVPIDFGAFNVPLGRFVRGSGIRTVYYFPPGSWRRRGRDNSALLAAADKIVTPFPWSEQLLRASGADAHFLGHPILDRMATSVSREEFRRSMGVPDGARIVGLLPGSRNHEIDNIMPVLLGASAIISKAVPDVALYPVAAGSERAAKSIGLFSLKNGDKAAKCRVLVGMTREVMAFSDLVISCSGTATLETMIYGTPMIIVYRGSRLMNVEFLFRKSILEEFIGMPNIVAGRCICPELLAGEASAEGIADMAVGLLADMDRSEQMRADLRAARQVLGESGGSARTARIVLETALGS